MNDFHYLNHKPEKNYETDFCDFVRTSLLKTSQLNHCILSIIYKNIFFKFFQFRRILEFCFECVHIIMKLKLKL